MVVETAPPAPFIIAEAEFLLELLVVALDPPSQLGDIDQTLKADLPGRVASQYLVGSASPCGHSISSHSSAARLAQPGIAMRRPYALPGEAR